MSLSLSPGPFFGLAAGLLQGLQVCGVTATLQACSLTSTLYYKAALVIFKKHKCDHAPPLLKPSERHPIAPGIKPGFL